MWWGEVKASVGGWGGRRRLWVDVELREPRWFGELADCFGTVGERALVVGQARRTVLVRSAL